MQKRYIKIITSEDIANAKFIISSKDFEPIINNFYNEISKLNGNILKTQYCISNIGNLEAVIIEYELLEKGENN